MPSRKELANAIRALSMDAVQKANSGHPGMPMGMADIAEVLWNDFLKHNPNNPHWINRDRFILSNGHGSMLQYSLLHLTGYDLSIDDIKSFRQLDSKTPGHPEFAETPGVETTTGPLGQGIANGVGMAIGETMLATQFNRPGHSIINHYTYVFMGDGCMMEGISHEVCSLAGTLKLGKLIAFWDDNEISIDGDVNDWFTDNTPERFKAYGWHVVANVDGHNPEAIKQAILQAQAVTDKPSLICCKTIIGYGAPNAQGGHNCHGAPLGDKEIQAARETLNWPFAPFEIPAEIYTAWDKKQKGHEWEETWHQQFKAYQLAYPDLAEDLIRRLSGELPEAWASVADNFIKLSEQTNDNIATRKASFNCLNTFAPLLPELVGGSADLSGSNLTNWKGSTVFNADCLTGNYLHYGVREFGMSAIMNGLALYGGFIPFGGTFLTFTDYARNAVRLAALMKLHCIFVYTHDSIGLGEDGPTHQPIEHASMLRLTPGLNVWRPCDNVETAVAWRFAIENNQAPTCLLLSRQNVPHQEREVTTVENIDKGGYVLIESPSTPEVIIIATGSEISLAVAAAKELNHEGRNIRVVSMPCTELFDQQDHAYKETVLPSNITKRLAIEAASKDFWYKYVGLNGRIIGMNQFGKSAPDKALFEHYGFTVENVIKNVYELIEGDLK